MISQCRYGINRTNNNRLAIGQQVRHNANNEEDDENEKYYDFIVIREMSMDGTCHPMNDGTTRKVMKK